MKRTKNKMITANLNWHFKVMEYITYFGLFIIPLYVGHQQWFPFGAPKALLIYLVTLVMLGLFGWGLWTDRQESMTLRITPVHIALGGFLIILIVSGLVGVDPHRSFFGTWGQAMGVMLIITASIWAMLIGFLTHRKKSVLYHMIAVAFASGVLVAIIAYGGRGVFLSSGEGSTLGNPSYVGAYLLFIACFGIGLLGWYKKYWQKITVGLGILAILFSPIFLNHGLFTGLVSWGDVFRNPLLLIGQSQGAFMGMVIAFGVIASLVITRHRALWVRIAGAGMFLVILVTMMITGLVLKNPNSALHAKFIEEKTGNRILFWDIARTGFTENPVLGNGFNNYSYTFQKHFKTEFYQPGFAVEPWTNQPHNIFWEYLSTTGLLGTVGFLTLLGVAFVVLYIARAGDSRHDVVTLALAGALVGYFAQNLFVFDVPIIFLVLFTVLGIAIGVSEKHWNITMSNRWHHREIISGVLMIMSAGGMIVLVILPWHESKRWLIATDKNMIVNNFERLEKLQGISPMGGVADAAFLVDSFFSKYQQDVIKNIQNTKSLASLIAVEDFLEKNLEKQPLNFRAHMTLAKIMIMHMFLESSSQEKLLVRAEDHIMQAQELNGQNPDTYFALASLFVVKKDFGHARTMVRAGIALAPEYADGYSIANDVNKLQPNALFMNYVNDMKERFSADQ